MRIGLIGIGQAGGKIVDKFLEYDFNNNTNFVRDCLAVNTAHQDLSGLTNVPEEKRLLIGESDVKGNGVGANNKKGRDIMRKEVNEVIHLINDMPTHQLDAFVIVASLGGGTGSGGMPVLAKELKERYSEPVYGIGILPANKEGQIYTVNAARSLQPCVEQLDNLMIFDNDSWSRGKGSLETWYNDLNNKIADRFGTIFSSGEIKEDEDVAESVIDASEVINTLDCGGISSIGYASDELDDAIVNPGILTRLKGGVEINESESTMRLNSLVEKSITGNLTIPANIDSTERALVILSGPKEFMTRKGMEEGRRLVEEKTNCMEVRGGDYPKKDSNEMVVTVLLSGLHDLPRVRELQRIAVEADGQIKQIREERGDKLDKLLNEENAEELDNLLDI
jgi:Cell division GTPase